MSAATLLKELHRQGVKVWAEGGKLRYSGPRPALTPDTLERIKARKSDLLALLERRDTGTLRARVDTTETRALQIIPTEPGWDALFMSFRYPRHPGGYYYHTRRVVSWAIVERNGEQEMDAIVTQTSGLPTLRFCSNHWGFVGYLEPGKAEELPYSRRFLDEGYEEIEHREQVRLVWDIFKAQWSDPEGRPEDGFTHEAWEEVWRAETWDWLDWEMFESCVDLLVRDGRVIESEGKYYPGLES